MVIQKYFSTLRVEHGFITFQANVNKKEDLGAKTSHSLKHQQNRSSELNFKMYQSCSTNYKQLGNGDHLYFL